jgi:hypothetical protein
MSDLSRMLDDLYALPDSDDDVVTEEPQTRAPEWSSAEALDEAFASWVPGEADGSTAFERSMVAEAPATLAEALHVDVDDWLTETEPVAAPVVTALRRWSPSDDDILPARRRSRNRGLRR